MFWLKLSWVKNNEKMNDFFNSLGLKMDLKEIVNNAIKEATEPLRRELTNIKQEFTIFKQQNEYQNEQLYFLVKRFSIYENEDCNYTRLIEDFNAKVYKSTDIKNKHYRFWEAISDWLGLDLQKLLNENNKKKYLKDKIGLDVLNYFVDNVILDRIVKNEKGHWVNLQGFNSDPFNIEKSKITKYWTDKTEHLRCCYCGVEIDEPQESITYDFEHYIAKTDPNTSNNIGNIGIACKECNKEKNSDDYIAFRNNKETNSVLSKRMDNWIDDYKIQDK